MHQGNNRSCELQRQQGFSDRRSVDLIEIDLQFNEQPAKPQVQGHQNWQLADQG